jgi:hypothetical protein
VSELAGGFKIAHAMLDALESDVVKGAVSAEIAREVLVEIVGSLRHPGKGKRGPGNVDKGFRYYTDDLVIIASLPNFPTSRKSKYPWSIERAVRAHWGEKDQHLKTRETQIRRQVDRLTELGVDPVDTARILTSIDRD